MCECALGISEGEGEICWNYLSGNENTVTVIKMNTFVNATSIIFAQRKTKLGDQN